MSAQSEDEEFEFRLRREQEEAAAKAAPQAIGNDVTLKRLWDDPAGVSRQGLQQLAQMVPNPQPTGNLPMDLIKGTPRIAADTLAQAAPPFASKLSLLGTGAAKLAGELAPVGKVILRSIGNQGEEMSGIAPKAAGALEAAYKDPSLFFSKGKQAAGEFYEGAKDELNAAKDTYRTVSVNADGTANMAKTEDVFSGMYKPEEIVDRANQFVKGGGELQPAEALKVRKAIDVLLKSKKSVPDELYKMRDEYDALSKASSNISKGDAAYQRGIKADAIHNVFPQNKYGGASAFKAMLLKYSGGLAAPLLSPITQGAAATAAGLTARNVIAPIVQNPSSIGLLSAALRAWKDRKAAQ